MLEGLDKVDWTKYYHYHGDDAVEIPKSLRALLSDNPEMWSHAEGVLFGSGQEGGYLTDATGIIIEFVIPLLEVLPLPRKISLLEAIDDAIFGILTRFSSVPYARSAIRVYDAIEGRLPTFLELLHSHESSIRREIARILGGLTDSGIDVIPHLIHQFHSESELAIQVEIIRSLGNLTQYCSQQEAYDGYVHFLRSLFETVTANIALKSELALALIKNMFIHKNLWKDELLRTQIQETLKEGFFLESSEFAKAELIQQLSRLGHLPLIDLVNDANLSALDAHLVSRFLLHKVFYIHGGQHPENIYPVYRTSTGGIVYSFSTFTITGIELRNNFPGLFPKQYRKGLFSSEQKSALQAIVNSERFWSIPTNLFSFFYGLPDSRDELRALIENASS
jgi:hypothetical protein